MDIENDDRKSNDMKKYNGAKRVPRKYSNASLSPVFPAKNTNSHQSIDCAKVEDRSGIQYDVDIIKINEGSLDIIDIDSSNTKKVLNDGMKLTNDKKSRRRRKSISHTPAEKTLLKIVEKNSSLTDGNRESFPTPLQAFADEMMKESKNSSTVPVQIKVNNKDWTVNVSKTVVSQSKSSCEFPQNRDTLFKALKEESYKLLKLVSKKNSIRNDVRMVFDPKENRITPFHINFKMQESVPDKVMHDDGLDMSKLISSDTEDSGEEGAQPDHMVYGTKGVINITDTDVSVQINDNNFPSCSDKHISANSVTNSNEDMSEVEICEEEEFQNLNGSLLKPIGTNEDDTSYRFQNSAESMSHLAIQQSETNSENVGSKEQHHNEAILSVSCESENTIKKEIIQNVPCDDSLKNNGMSGQPGMNDQLVNLVIKQESNQNSEIGRSDIPCISNDDQLDVEGNESLKEEINQNIYVDKTSNQPLVNLSAIQTEMTTVEENDESNIILENQNKTNSMYESEYIIPEIDFVDNTSFKSSNEQINYSDSISEGGSNSSDDLASDYDNNEVLSEDEVSEVEVHDMSHNVEFITGLESNEEIVTLSSLPSSSFHCLNSGHKISDQNVEMEKDPLYVDGFTERFLFYDPETNNDDSKIHRSGCKNESDTLDNMSDEEVDFSNAKNIRNLDNFDHAVRDEQESKGENLDDFNLPNKWNWSNLRKYNSRAVKNNLVKIRNHQCAVEQNNQKQIEEEKFIGFSDLTDSSSKYSEFVTACSKLGYYDDMVILNQHYEVSQPNKRGWKLQEVGTSSSVLSSKEKKIPDGDFNSSSSVKKSYSHLPRASSVERKKDTPKISKKSVATNKNHDHKLKDDQDGLFFGFGSNDNYNKLRKNSIEISRRLSEDFSCNKNEFNDSCYFASTDYSGSETEQNDSGNMVKEGKKIKCNVTHQNSENPLSLNRNSKFKCESGTEEVEPICYETEHCNQSTKQSPSSTPVMCSSSINQNKQLYERSLMSISDIESTSEKNILIPTTESVKRKRGRPRKNHILFSTSTPTDTTSSIFNSPNTYTTQQIVNYNSEDFNKSVENILDITSFQNNSLSEKGEHSSTVADLHSFTVLAPKRRGRPRNIFVAIGSSEILTVEQSDSCPTENDQLLSKLDNENDTEMDCLTGPDSLCNSRSSDEFHLEKGNTQSNKNIFVNSSIQDHNKDEHICIETVSDNNLKVERKKIVLEQNENKKWCDVRMSPSHMDEQTTNPYNDIIASVPESGIKIKSDNFIYDINPEEASIRKEISQISNCSQLESDIYPEHAMLRPIRNEKPQIQNTEGSIAIEYDEIGKKKDRFDTLNCIDLEDGTKNAVCIADKINSPCEIDTNYFTITPVDSIQTQVDCSTASPNRKIKTHDEPGIPLKYISLGKLETDHCQNKLNKVLNSNDFGTVIKEQIEGNISSDLVACKAVDCSENIPKKKPGRPRKNSLNHFNKDRKPNIVNESSDQIPLATDNTWETGVQHAEPIQKRKPGRPRKDSLYSASNKEDSKSVVENFDEKKIDEELNSKEITDKDEEKIVKNDDPDLWSTKTVTTIESSSSSPNQLQKVSFNLLNDKEGNSQGVIKNQGNNQCGEPKSNELSNKTHKIKKGNGISQEFFESKDVSVTSVHNKEGVKCKIGIIDCKNTKKLLKSNEFRNKNERIEGNLNTDSFLLKVEDMSKCDTDFSKEDVDRKSGCPKRDEFDPVCIKDKGENKLVAEIFSPISTSQYEKKHSCNSTKDIESLDTKRDDTQNSNVLIEKTKPSSGFLYVENIEKPINVEVTTDITFNFKDPIESNSSCKILIAEEDSCINKKEIVNNVSEQSIDLIEYSPLSPVFHKCGSLKKLPIMSTQTLNCVNSNNSNQPEIISVNVQMPVMASNDDDSNTFRDLVESDNYDSNDGKSDDNLKKDNSFSKEDILGHSTLKKKELLGKEDDCLEPPPKRKCGIPKRADVSSASKVEQEITQFEKECVIGQKSLKRNNDVTLDVSNNYTIMAKPGKSNVFPYETCTLISDKSSNIPDCNNDIKSNESISSMKNENPYVGLLQKIINLPYKKRGNKRKASTSCDNSFSDSENNIIMNANKSNYKNSNTNIEILDKFTHLLPEKQTSQKNEFIIEKNKQEAFAENVCNNSDSRFGVITVPERPCLTDAHLNEEPCLSFSQTIMPNHIATKTDNINSLSDTEIISCNSSCNNIEDKISKEHLTQIGCNSENNDSCYEGDISCPAVLNSVDLIETQVNCLEPQLKRRPGRPPKRRSIDSTQIEKASNKRQHILNVDNGESVNSNFLTGSVSIKVSESFFKLTEDIDQNKSASKIYLDKKSEGIPHSIDMKYKNKEILRVNDILSETLLEAKEMMKTENNPLDVTVDSGNKDQLRNSNEVSVKIEGNDISHKIHVKAIEIIKNSGGSSQLIPKRKPGRPKKYRMNTNEDCKCETEIIDGMSTNKVLNPNGFNNEEGELNKRNDDSDLVPFKVEETDNDRMNSSEPLQNRKPLPKISLPVNTEDEIIVKQGIAYNGNEFDGMSNSNNIGSNSNLNQESSGICSQDSVKTENIVKSQIDCSEPTPKRKPGRPKKVSLNNLHTKFKDNSYGDIIDGRDIDEVLHANDFRIKDEEFNEENDNFVSASLKIEGVIITPVKGTEPSEKKKPGRPKKITLNTLHSKDDKSQDEVFLHDRKNRNEEVCSNELNNKIQEVSIGNYICQESLEAEEIVKNIMESSKHVIKKKPGRPKKVSLNLLPHKEDCKSIIETIGNKITNEVLNLNKFSDINQMQLHPEKGDSGQSQQKKERIITTSMKSCEPLLKRKRGRPRRVSLNLLNTNEDCNYEMEIIDGISKNKVLNPNGFNNEEGELNKRNDDSDLVPFKVEETDNDRMNSSEPLQNRKPLPEISLPVNTEDEIIVKQGITYNGNEFDGMPNSNNVGSNNNLNQESSGICSQDSVKTENIVKSQTDCSEPIPKRKPGRPKKVSLNNLHTKFKDNSYGDIIDGRNIDEVLHANDFRIKDEELNEENDNFVSASLKIEGVIITPVKGTEPSEKKKPGRPKKITINTLHSKDDKSQDEGFLHDRKNRNEEVCSNELNNKIQEVSIGNYMCQESLEAEEIVKNIMESSKQVIKKKPGRPKKVSLNLLPDKEDCKSIIETIGNKITNEALNLNKFSDINQMQLHLEKGDSGQSQQKIERIITTSMKSCEPLLKRKRGRPRRVSLNPLNTNEDCKYETKIINEISTNKVLNPNGFNNEEGELNKRNDDSDLVPFKVEETDNDRMNSSEPLQNRKPLPKISLPVNTEDEIIVKQGIAYNGNEFDGMSNSNNIGSNSNLNQESSGICSQDSVKTENIVKSQIDCSEPTPKRKPGRPKKNRVPLSCNDEVAFSSETGDQNRKKNEILNSNNNLRSSLSLSEGNGGFSLDSIEAEKVAFTPTACSEHVFKRKRGRPRKVPKIATSTPVNCHSQTSHESGIGSHSIKNCMEGARASPAHFSRRSVRVKRDTSFLDSEFIQISYDNSKYIDDNSFFDVSLLDESPQCLPKKQRGRKKGFKVKQDIDAENEDINCLYTNYIIYSNEGIKLETFEQNLENHNATEFNISPVEANSSQEMTGQNQLELTSKQLARQMTEGQNQLELTSKQLARLTKKKSLSGRVDTSTRLRRPNDMVKCAVCGEIMKVKDYQKIHLVKHNFISWLEGEEPLPVDDFDSMDVVLTRGKRAYPRLFFKCEICGHEKKSSKGFLSHRQICGKTDKERQNMLQPCVYCGRLLMPSSLPPHLYQNHRSQTEAIQQEPLGPMRKAAARCLGKIASYIEDEVSAVNADDFHQDVDGDEEFDEIEEISLLYVPIQKKKLTKHLLERWKLLVSENKEISCYLPTCDFKTFSYDNILEHHKSCISGDCQGYSCIKCNYVCKIEDEMREHVKSCNPPIIVSQSEDSESEEHEKNVVIPYLKTAEQNLVYQRIKCHFFKPALKWMKQIYEAYFSKEILFHEFEFNLDLWKELDAQTCKFYNPELSESMKISYQNSSWENMHTLEGKVLEGDQGLGFTGGPIWALEWCPGEGDQYLAVSSHLKMETNFEAGSTFTGPGLIQLWSLEDIENSRNVPLSTLQFSYGICHNERSCWSMAWCPSGARTEKRIGLLALATTSGSIPVYAMPNPQCLLSQSTRFYKPEPVLKLELWSNERWQCYSISWSKVKPHTIIAAGFVNGIVAIWDLSSQSKLLRNKNILHPFKVFQAHHSIITGICLSPESDSYLATASYDKSFKYWDLKDTTAPQSVLKRGLFTSVGWLRHWMSAVTTYDNAYTMLQTSVSLNSIRSFVAPTMQIVTSVNSTSWSVSVSDWLNGAVASYDNGQVVLFFALKQTYYQHLEKRKYTKVLLQSSLHSFESNSSEPLSKENNIPSNSYGDAVQKYGLAIRTDLAIGKYDKLSEKGTESMNDIYPLSSINRVSWNSNKQSFLYVAMGYQSGFLVVSKLSMPKTDQALIDEVSKSE